MKQLNPVRTSDHSNHGMVSVVVRGRVAYRSQLTAWLAQEIEVKPESPWPTRQQRARLATVTLGESGAAAADTRPRLSSLPTSHSASDGDIGSNDVALDECVPDRKCDGV